MNQRISLAAAAAGGGMLAAAFLSTAVAVADDGGSSDAAGLTAGDLTFTPAGDTEPEYSIDLPPLLQIGSAPDAEFTVADSDGDELGTFTSDEDVSTILGVDTTSFTFDADSFEAADGAGNGGDGGAGGSIDADAIADALREAGISDSDFGEDQNVDSLADALAGDDLNFDGDITGDDVVGALQGTEVADDFDIELDEGDSPEFSSDIDFTKGDVADALNTLSGDGGSADGDAADLPADGTEFSFTDFGLGIENVYEAVPASDGGSAEITDTLVTPFGNLDLSPVFHFFDSVFGGLFGDIGEDGGQETGANVDGSDVAGALAASDTDFSDGDLSNALADNLDFDSGDITGDDIITALDDTAVADGLDIEDGSFSDADFQPDDVADALNNIDATGGDVDASDVESALEASDTDFSNFDLSSTLASSDLDFGSGDITGDEVFGAVKDTNVGDDVLDVTSNGGFDDVDFTPDDLADALNAGDFADGADPAASEAGGIFADLFSGVF